MAPAPESEARPTHVLAAGGLLEQSDAQGVRIAVVHRTRYEDRDGNAGDWVLPKGKVRSGERLEDAALREVREETGCRGRVVGPSFCSEYLAHGVPKVTIFFRMVNEEQGAIEDASEVREIAWLEPGEAVARLTYDSERSIVRSAYAEITEEEDDR